MKENNNFIILTRDELRKVCGGREVLPDNLKYLEDQRGRKPSDFDIYSISDGKVIDVQYVQYDKGQEKRGYGTYIKIKHADGTVARYAHLSHVDVKKGDEIKKGQTIGIMGNTGTKTDIKKETLIVIYILILLLRKVKAIMRYIMIRLIQLNIF